MSTTFDVTSPFDLSVIGTQTMTSRDEVHAALARAHALYEDRASWLDAPTRIAVLQRFAELVTARTDELARQAAHEGGKPLKDSLVEIVRAIDGVHVAIKEISGLHGTEIPMGLNAASLHRTAHTFREPRGVVLAISAFNHPFNLIIHQAITAVAAGCPVLVKPALNTSLSAKSVVEMLTEAGLPDGWCQLILTDNEVTESLVSDKRVAYMTFIGSAKVGWYLRSKLAPGALCALEHGGVAPVIVDATADLDAAIAPLVRGGFYHAGQVCVSVQRVYLASSIADAFINKFVAATKELKTGDPLDATTDVGPLITQRELQRIEDWVDAAVTGGAKLLCGGKRITDTTFEPTVLLNPKDDAEVSQLEVFGPVVVLYTYEDIDEAVRRANALDVYFQAALFTRDLDTALGISRRLNGVAVMVNDHTAFRVDWMPFGGHRSSGLGTGGIGFTVREMTLQRMVVFHSAAL